jgi:hypothetical protein
MDPNLTAASIGAGAALLGALSGAWVTGRLQWRRDANQLLMQRQSIYGAIFGELNAITAAVSHKRDLLSAISDSIAEDRHLIPGLHRSLRLPRDTVFIAVSGQIGLLGAQDAANIARMYAYKTTVDDMLAHLEETILQGRVEKDELNSCLEELDNFIAEATQTIESVPRATSLVALPALTFPAK